MLPETLTTDYVPLRPAAGFVRIGVVTKTDETEKMEIAGLPAGVHSERNGTARIYVFIGSKQKGPYTLPSEVVQ